MQRFFLLPGCALLLILASCTESPQTAAKKEPEKPPEPVTGQSALYRMYQVARSWATDAQVLKMNSMILEEVKDVPRGKAAAWQAMFVSPQSARARSYTYSVIEGAGNLHKGVFAGLEEGWSGHRGVSAPFLIAALKTDSNDVLQTALKNSKVAEYDAKNPGKAISFILEKTDRFPDPTWRVLWGETVGTSSFSVFVDATTGIFQQIMR